MFVLGRGQSLLKKIKICFFLKDLSQPFRARGVRKKEGNNACEVVGGKFHNVCAVSCVILNVTLCSLW